MCSDGWQVHNWGFVVCSNQSMLVVWSLSSFFRLMVTRVLSIASKCNEFISSICLHCIPISENIHLFGLLFVFPEPLDRVWTQLCTSGCFWLYFLLWKNSVSCLKLDGSQGEKGRKVKVEEQLVLTLAEDSNTNSDAVSPHFHYMGKEVLFQSLWSVSIAATSTQNPPFCCRTGKLFSTLKASSWDVEEQQRPWGTSARCQPML